MAPLLTKSVREAGGCQTQKEQVGSFSNSQGGGKKQSEGSFRGMCTYGQKELLTILHS